MTSDLRLDHAMSEGWPGYNIHSGKRSRMSRNDNGSWFCWDCGFTVILFDEDVHECEAAL